MAWRRGPVEAAAAGREWPAPVGFVYRGNLCTLDGGVLRDAQVSGLSAGETAELAQALDDGLAGEGIRVLPTGAGTVAVGMCEMEAPYPEGVAPFAHVGAEVSAAWPGRSKWPRLQVALEVAERILGRHPLNDVRVDLGENPANGLWLWGGGAPVRPRAHESGGGMVTRSVLGRGVAALRGLDVIEPADPWRDPRQDPRHADPVLLPVREVVEALRTKDLLLVHVAAPRPGGGFGSAVDKVRALDHVDQRLLGPLLELLRAYRPCRMILAADAAVSTETLRPQRVPVPVVVAGDGIAADSTTRWEEETCLQGRLGRMNLQDFLRATRMD